MRRINVVEIGTAFGKNGLGINATIKSKLLKRPAMNLSLCAVVAGGALGKDIPGGILECNPVETSSKTRELLDSSETVQLRGVQVLAIDVHLQNLLTHVIRVWIATPARVRRGYTSRPIRRAYAGIKDGLLLVVDGIHQRHGTELVSDELVSERLDNEPECRKACFYCDHDR